MEKEETKKKTTYVYKPYVFFYLLNIFILEKYCVHLIGKKKYQESIHTFIPFYPNNERLRTYIYIRKNTYTHTHTHTTRFANTLLLLFYYYYCYYYSQKCPSHLNWSVLPVA